MIKIRRIMEYKESVVEEIRRYIDFIGEFSIKYMRPWRMW